jgi:hypothetical protein
MNEFISPKTNTNEENSRDVHTDWIGSSSEDNMQFSSLTSESLSNELLSKYWNFLFWMVSKQLQCKEDVH